MARDASPLGLLSHLKQVAVNARYVLRFVDRTDLRNLDGFRRTADILSRPSLADWWYARDYALSELPRMAAYFVLDAERMNEFQEQSPEAGYTSTPVDGLLAGFTREGRMSSLFYPHTGFTDQVPYLQTGDGHLGGSKPREGGFLGVRTEDGVAWLWEDSFEHEMVVEEGTNVLHLQARADGAGDAPAVEVEEYDYVIPGTDVLARDFEVTATGDDDVRGLTYYAQVNANTDAQYTIAVTSPNAAYAGDELRWESESADVGLRVFPASAPVARSGVADAPLDDVRDAGTGEAHGRYLGGYLDLDVAAPPGERATATVYTTGSDNEPSPAVLARDPEARRELVREWWARYLDGTDDAAVPDRHAAQYRRSVAGMAMLYDPASGSLSAAPNSQPSYYFSWPRDGGFIAIALAEAGMADVATDYLGRFCPSVQEADGSFEQCYASTGDASGVIAVENDQQAIYLHAVRRVYDVTGDEVFLRRAWPAVQRAADYTADAVVDNGLLAATHDFAEMWTDARQSLWTNAFAYRGLLDAAALADELGEGEAAERYRDAAERVGDAVESRFFDGVADGFATHLDVRGSSRDESTTFAAAIHPTRWAADYDFVDELFEAFDDFYEAADERWLPKEFTYVGALYHHDRLEEGDAILDALASERLPGGTLAEVVDDEGDHLYAALGWSNAAFVHALHERATAAD